MRRYRVFLPAGTRSGNRASIVARSSGSGLGRAAVPPASGRFLSCADTFRAGYEPGPSSVIPGLAGPLPMMPRTRPAGGHKVG